MGKKKRKLFVNTLHTCTHTLTHLFIYLFLNHELHTWDFAILTDSCLCYSGISYRSMAITVHDFLEKKKIFF